MPISNVGSLNQIKVMLWFKLMEQIQQPDFVRNIDNSTNRLDTYIGENCVSKMIIELYKISKACIKEMRENQQIEMNDVDDMDIHNANCCYLCKKGFYQE